MAAALHVAVVGAGTLGLSTAVNLVERGARVTVLEARSIAAGSSGRSVGVIGTQLTDPFQIMLRRHALRQFRRWETLGLRFNRIGYLRLARTEAQMALLERSVALQAEAGFRARLCPAGALTELVPHLDPTGLAGGIFGPDDGFIDPPELCALLAGLVRQAGGAVRQSCPLTGLSRARGVYRLETVQGVVDCDAVVNAAGAWAPQVAALLGQTLHLRPERHEAVEVRLDQPLDYVMPMVMDLVNGEGTGLNFRHDRPGLLIAEIHKAAATSLPADPDAYNEQCEEESRVRLAELLLERLPGLPGARLGRGWAGLYPESADHRPLVGPIDPAEPLLVTAAGAGGYGIQLAPVIGQVAADWVVHGGPVSAPGTEALLPSGARNGA
jgi:sarcosine oxidase subunit beta